MILENKPKKYGTQSGSARSYDQVRSNSTDYI